MGVFQITAEDFLKGQIVTPGWHPCIVVKVEDKTSEQKGTNGTEITFKIVAGEFKGVPLTVAFWESAIGMAVPMLDAINGKPIERKPGSIVLTEQALKGKALDVEVKKGSFNNRPKNDVVGFKPYSGPAIDSAAIASAKPAGV